MTMSDADAGGQQDDEVSIEDVAEYEARMPDLQARYEFYIMNPAQEPGVEYSLWVHEDGHEYPVMSSNTGGFVTFNTRHDIVGDGIEPTEEFLTLVGYGFHEAMCFMPDLYFRDDHYQNTVNRIYNGQERGHEVWAAAQLISWMAAGDQMIPELRPLVEWAGQHTEFGVPVLGGDDGE